MRHVLVYGDSNSFGTKPMPSAESEGRFAPADRWPEVMRAALGPDYVVYNESLPGRTTVLPDPITGDFRSGLAVLPAVLLSHIPLDMVIFMLGTNDLHARYQVAAAEITHGLSRLVDTARLYVPGIEIGLIAPLPVVETGPFAVEFRGVDERQEGLCEAIRELAEKQNAAFLDAAPLGAVSPVDGIHFDADVQHAIGAAAAQMVALHLEGKTT